ncbi:hypothetical protein KP001_21260 [Geomonas subterranea]|uniref:Glycosyltransferase RgtA/B/C/D-like domain-containing protein n=1 Tax=Geomonas subterranea TaxID=2847989 RepID=A0ABX8LGR0_9BACT|nr:hypothetical protein [Geomonas subterranea]QXE90872.1 hypothetical protein KP001_21260 [Geomonas subterranea]QXM11044.1 hypothetical protein KP002_08015 [Geomonas subterranea]
MKSPRHLTRYLVPPIADLLLVTLLCALFFTSPSPLLLDGDTGFHIRAGEEILRTRAVPRFDIFSQHAPALPWTAHEWLAEAVMALSHQAAGMSGVVALYALLLAVTFRLLFRALVSYRAGILTATAVTLATLVCSQMHWLARPHLFTFLFLVVFHHRLESWRREGGRSLWLLPPLMLLWVNLHGGFAAGFLLLAAYLAGTAAGMAGGTGDRRAARKKGGELGAVLLACLVAALVNPYGWRLLLFPLRLVSDRYLMDHVAEFLPPSIHGWLPFNCLLLLLIALFALSPKKTEPTELLLVLGFGYMALTSVRYIPLFGLVTAPVLAARLGELGREGGGRCGRALREVSVRLGRLERRPLPPLWGAVALAVVTAAATGGLFHHAFDRRLMPVDACEFVLRTGIKGRVFNSDEFGDYLIYRGYPDCRVFIDGRLDMYGARRLREYNEIIAFRPGWDQVLERYGITWIMFEADSDFARFLQQRSEWRLVYSDQVAKVFEKTAVPR